MSRVSGTYSDGTPKQYGDYCQVLTNRGDRVMNLIEINDWGDLIFTQFNEQDETDYNDIVTVEDYCADFLKRVDDSEIVSGRFI